MSQRPNWQYAWRSMPAESCPERVTAVDAATIDAITDAPQTPEDVAAQSEISALLRAHLDKLPWREAYTIRANYGLDAGPPQTQREIAKMFGVSASFVSELEIRAFRRLRKRMRKHRAECLP